MSFDEQKQLEDTYVMPTFGRKPVQLVEGKGMHVRDDAGNDYLDFIAGIGVNCLGHCHPAVIDALQSQAAKLIHVSNYYYIQGRAEVAQTVSDLLNSGMPENARTTWQSFFANSGAEANECSIKLARLWSKKQGNGGAVVITMDGSFHGRTMLTLAATAQPAKQEAFKPLPTGFVHTPLNDIESLQAAFDQNKNQVCAVMLECVQGESGVHPCSQEFMQQVRQLATQNDALVICDEVQSGIFRCGTPFAFQNFDGFTPDIVSIAKGIGGGFPMGMCAARKDVACSFEPGDHGSTFGGSNLAIAAATATLGQLTAPGFADDVVSRGDYFRSRLQTIEGIVNVRGLGLMIGCDVNDDISAPDVVARGLKAGFLLNATGAHTLRFLPPLICTVDDIDALIAALPGLLHE